MDLQDSANRHLRDVLVLFANSALQSKQVNPEGLRPPLRNDTLEETKDVEAEESGRLRDEVQQLRKDLRDVQSAVQVLSKEKEILQADRDALAARASLKRHSIGSNSSMTKMPII